MSPFLIDVFFHKVQLIAHPAFVKLNSTVFGQNVKYPQVFGAILFQTTRATKAEGLCQEACSDACLCAGEKDAEQT